MNAYRNAISRSRSYRPDEPPWPPARLTLKYSGFASVLRARSFATHFDGSQYITWESLKDVVTSIQGDRKSTRLNSSHLVISYAVFCLKKKKKTYINKIRTKNYDEQSKIINIKSARGSSI